MSEQELEQKWRCKICETTMFIGKCPHVADWRSSESSLFDLSNFTFIKKDEFEDQQQQIQSLTQQLEEKTNELRDLKTVKALCLWSNQTLEINKLTQQLKEKQEETRCQSACNAKEIGRLKKQVEDANKMIDSISGSYKNRLEIEYEKQTQLKQLVREASDLFLNINLPEGDAVFEWLKKAEAVKIANVAGKK